MHVIWGAGVLRAAFRDAPKILRTYTWAMCLVGVTIMAFVYYADITASTRWRFGLHEAVSAQAALMLAIFVRYGNIPVWCVALRDAARAARDGEPVRAMEVTATIALVLLMGFAESTAFFIAAGISRPFHNPVLSVVLAFPVLLMNAPLSLVVPAFLVGGLRGENFFSTAWTLCARRPWTTLIFWLEVITPVLTIALVLPRFLLAAAARDALLLAVVATPVICAAVALLTQAYWSSQIAFYVRLRDTVQENEHQRAGERLEQPWRLRHSEEPAWPDYSEETWRLPNPEEQWRPAELLPSAMHPEAVVKETRWSAERISRLRGRTSRRSRGF